MATVNSEDDFQDWVMARLAGLGAHYQDHRWSQMVNVPDLSAAWAGADYWFELKFERFRLGHDRYDLFRFKQTTAGQLAWLRERSEAGFSICGILGYMKFDQIDYLYFGQPDVYREHANGKMDCGALLLMGKWTAKFDDIRTGVHLINFMRSTLGRRR